MIWHPNSLRFLDFRATLRDCNFAHTCRRLKSSGVFESRCSNSFIFVVLRPIRPGWATSRGWSLIGLFEKMGTLDMHRPNLSVSFWDVHYSESESKKCFSCGEMSGLQAEIACSMEIRSVPQKNPITFELKMCPRCTVGLQQMNSRSGGEVT